MTDIVFCFYVVNALFGPYNAATFLLLLFLTGRTSTSICAGCAYRGGGRSRIRALFSLSVSLLLPLVVVVVVVVFCHECSRARVEARKQDVVGGYGRDRHFLFDCVHD